VVQKDIQRTIVVIMVKVATVVAIAHLPQTGAQAVVVQQMVETMEAILAHHQAMEVVVALHQG